MEETPVSACFFTGAGVIGGCGGGGECADEFALGDEGCEEGFVGSMELHGVQRDEDGREDTGNNALPGDVDGGLGGSDEKGERCGQGRG